MNRPPRTLADRAAALRDAFDRSFSRAPVERTARSIDLLAIRLRADPYALRLSDIAGLFAGKPVTPLPGPLPELLGLAGFRGVLIPVYDLGHLLGYRAGRGDGPLVLAAGRPQVALAFDQFEAHLHVLPGDLAPVEGTARAGTREMVRLGDQVRPIVEIAALLEDLARRVHTASRAEER